MLAKSNYGVTWLSPKALENARDLGYQISVLIRDPDQSSIPHLRRVKEIGSRTQYLSRYTHGPAERNLGFVSRHTADRASHNKHSGQANTHSP